MKRKFSDIETKSSHTALAAPTSIDDVFGDVDMITSEVINKWSSTRSEMQGLLLSSTTRTGAVERVLSVKLPIRITLPYILRHKLTHDDWHMTLKHTESVFLWHLALLLNIGISNAAVKDSFLGSVFESHFMSTHGSKSQAVDRLMTWFESAIKSPLSKRPRMRCAEAGNQTSMELFSTFIPLPMYEIKRDLFDKLASTHDHAVRSADKKLPSRFGRALLQYSLCFRWRDILVVPWMQMSCPNREYLKHARWILLARIVPHTIHDSIYGPDSSICLADARDQIRIGSEVWTVLDEMFYVWVMA